MSYILPEQIIGPMLETVGVDVYSVTAPYDAPRPHLVYLRTMTEPIYDLKSERVAEKAEMRVDIWCTSADELTALYLDVLDAVGLFMIDAAVDPAKFHGWQIYVITQRI